jgi:hypothetical protein
MNLRQPRARYVMSCTIPWYGYSRRPMNSYTVLDPLGSQAVCRPGLLLGWGGEDILGESTTYIFQFYLYLAPLHNFNSLLYAGTFLFDGRR